FRCIHISMCEFLPPHLAGLTQSRYKRRRGRKRRAERIKLRHGIESAYAAEPACLVEPARAAKSACPVESTDIRPCRKASLCRAATTHPPQDPVFAVTASDSLESLFAASGASFRLLTEEQRQASLDTALAHWNQRDDLWVYGYGSLIWRPEFDFVERRHALLRGYHQSLCLWSRVNRGTPERPGLVFGLA